MSAEGATRFKICFFGVWPGPAKPYIKIFPVYKHVPLQSMQGGNRNLNVKILNNFASASQGRQPDARVEQHVAGPPPPPSSQNRLISTLTARAPTKG